MFHAPYYCINMRHDVTQFWNRNLVLSCLQHYQLWVQLSVSILRMQWQYAVIVSVCKDCIMQAVARFCVHFPQIEEACNRVRAVNGWIEEAYWYYHTTALVRLLFSTLIDHQRERNQFTLTVPVALAVVNVEHARRHHFHVV